METTAQQAGGYVGRSILRSDADAKLRGRAQYVDDLKIPGLWHGFVVRSPVAHGKLRGLRQDPAFDWSRVTVVTAADIPGENLVDMFVKDMPYIAHDEVQYIGEPVALVAAPTLQLAQAAAACIHPDIDPLPALLTTAEMVARYKAADPAQPLHKLAGQSIRKGDLAAGLAAADHVIEREFWTGYQEQLYLEPQGLVAHPQADGGLLIEGSLQCPYFVAPELVSTLKLPVEKIRVRQSAVGGAFGGKEDYPTFLAGYVALLALKSRHPVKIVYDRHEDILYTPKRHPSWTRFRVGLKKDGTITAIQVEYLLDGGGYATLSPIVLNRGVLHCANGYRCANVLVEGFAFRTHTVPSGAFRGFGAPQAIWGLESMIDLAAEWCGQTPEQYRLQQCIRLGDTTPTGQLLKDSVGSPAVLEQALAHSAYAEKFRRCSHGDPAARTWYGIGLAFFPHGSGFTGNGEGLFRGRGALELVRGPAGAPQVVVRVSSTEMGQGAHTVMEQIAADALSAPIAAVTCPFPDTSLVPNSGPTVASRTTMVVGHVVHLCGADMKGKLEEFAGTHIFGGRAARLERGEFRAAGEPPRAFAEVAAAWLDRRGPLRVEHAFDLPPNLKWNQQTFEGDSYPAYSWGCNVAEVEIDTLTMQLRVTRVTGVFDIGRVVNPLMAVGQLQGGLLQAVGYAVMEKIGIKDGRYDASRLQTYIIPTILDAPDFDIHFVEYPYDYAAPGAKGVGEIPLDGLAPAIGNAVYQATGWRFNEIPITPEMLLARLRQGPGGR